MSYDSKVNVGVLLIPVFIATFWGGVLLAPHFFRVDDQQRRELRFADQQRAWEAVAACTGNRVPHECREGK